jgi:aspartokinase-like uncharacterized kinase
MPRHKKIKVIKLGGSLEQSRQLIDCLNCIANNVKDNMIIVPGGGLFAEHVRQSQQRWQFNDAIAHEMAILAMQQMALLFHSLQPNFQCLNTVKGIQSQIKKKAQIIWSPKISELNKAGIQASWDITSDSLAAWLAMQLQANQLSLVKATNVPDEATITQLIKRGILDKAFSSSIQNAPFKTQIISADNFHQTITN